LNDDAQNRIKTIFKNIITLNISLIVHIYTVFGDDLKKRKNVLVMPSLLNNINE
jgi:hypothetical protein